MDVERELAGFQFRNPPEWLKARAVTAARNVVARQEARRRVQKILWTAIAAGLLLAVAGHYVANALAPVMPNRPSLVKASPLGGYPVDPSELLSGDYQSTSKDVEELPGGLVEDGASAPSDTGQEGK